MLEERLSSTYHQANAMYGLPAATQRPASNLYPSIQSSAPDGPVGESYYNSNATPSDAYRRPQSYYGGGYQATPQPLHSQRASVPPQPYASPQEQYQQPQQPSQPYPNLASYGGGTAPQQRPPSTTYQKPASPQLQRQVSNQQYPPQPSSYPPQAPPSTVSDTESASFYYGDSNAAQPSQPPMQRTQSLASQPSQQAQPSSPQLYNRGPPQQAPLSPPAQPATAWQNPPYPRQEQPPNWQQQDQNQAAQQQSAPQQAPQQAPPSQAPAPQAPPPQQYWQQRQQAPQQQQSSAWQPAPYATGGYGPESFPSAPQNQLPAQQKVVDEPLIDL